MFLIQNQSIKSTTSATCNLTVTFVDINIPLALHLHIHANEEFNLRLVELLKSQNLIYYFFFNLIV